MLFSTKLLKRSRSEYQIVQQALTSENKKNLNFRKNNNITKNISKLIQLTSLRKPHVFHL